MKTKSTVQWAVRERARRQCLTACSELQSDWVRAVGERGLQYCSVERGPESLGRRNTLNANVGPGGGAAISRHPEARGAVVRAWGIRLGNWYIVHVLVACTVDSHSGGGCMYSRDESLSAGTGVFSNKPGKEDRMQGTYSSRPVRSARDCPLCFEGQRPSSFCCAADISSRRAMIVAEPEFLVLTR